MGTAGKGAASPQKGLHSECDVGERRRAVWPLEPNHSFKDGLFSQLHRHAKLFKVLLLLSSHGYVGQESPSGVGLS